jgi:hypothetical protein
MLACSLRFKEARGALVDACCCLETGYANGKLETMCMSCDFGCLGALTRGHYWMMAEVGSDMYMAICMITTADGVTQVRE